MHTKKLPTSIAVLQEVFQKADIDGNGTLDLEEAKACLIELNLYSNDKDVQILFQALDVDRSGTLSLEEFLDLTKKAHAANYVVDYIPLVEIIDVQAELHRREGVKFVSPLPNEETCVPAAKAMLQASDVVVTDVDNESFFKKSLRQLEVAIGMDIDGDGQAAQALMPKYDPSVSEVHIMITTIEGGHNAGKTYVHRLPDSDAQAWLKALTSAGIPKGSDSYRRFIWALTFENSCRSEALSRAVKEAKITARRNELLRRYGHSKFSMAREKTRIMYESEAFQMSTAFIIMLAFVLDMCEAQVPNL
jgi:hypothetical protein